MLDVRGIKKLGQFLVFGERVVRETLQEHSERCVELIYPTSWSTKLPASKAVSHYFLEGNLFRTLDLFGTKVPLLGCTLPHIDEWDREKASQGLELVCPLGDPSNVGAVLRTCQAFGVRKVILLKESASPFHPKSIRASSGAVFKVEFVYGPSVDDLNESACQFDVVALDISGKDLADYRWPQNVRLLIGEEGLGLPKYEFPTKVSIPMAKGMHSLNASVAASLAMYAYRLQHPLRELC